MSETVYCPNFFQFKLFFRTGCIKLVKRAITDIVVYAVTMLHSIIIVHIVSILMISVKLTLAAELIVLAHMY